MTTASKTVAIVKHDPSFTTEYPQLVRQGVTNHMVNAGLRIDSFDEAKTSVVVDEEVARSILATMVYYTHKYGTLTDNYQVLGVSVSKISRGDFLPFKTALAFKAKQIGKFGGSLKENATFIFKVKLQPFTQKKDSQLRTPVGSPLEVEYTLEKRYNEDKKATTYTFSFRGDNPLALHGSLNVFKVAENLLRTFVVNPNEELPNEDVKHPELANEASFMAFQLKVPFILFSHLMLRATPAGSQTQATKSRHHAHTLVVRHIPNSAVSLDKLTLSRYVKFNDSEDPRNQDIDARQLLLCYLNTVYNVVRPNFSDIKNNGVQTFRGIRPEVFFLNEDTLHSDTYNTDNGREYDFRKMAQETIPKIAGVRLVRLSAQKNILNSIYFSLPRVKGRGIQNLESAASNSLESDYLKVTFTLHSQFFFNHDCRTIEKLMDYLGVDFTKTVEIKKFRDRLDLVLESQFEAYDFSYWISFSYIKTLSEKGRESLLDDMDQHKRHTLWKFFNFWSDLNKVNKSPAYSNAFTIYLKLFHESYWNEDLKTDARKEIEKAKQNFRHMVRQFKNLYGIDITYPLYFHKEIVSALYQSTQKMEDVYAGKTLQDNTLQAKMLMKDFSSIMALHSWQAHALTMAATVNKTRKL